MPSTFTRTSRSASSAPRSANAPYGPDPGVGHHHVGRAELGLQAVDGGGEGLGVGHVGDGVAGGVAQAGHDLAQAVLAAGDHPHPGAAVGGGLGDGPPDAPGRARDDRRGATPLHGPAYSRSPFVSAP